MDGSNPGIRGEQRMEGSKSCHHYQRVMHLAAPRQAFRFTTLLQGGIAEQASMVALPPLLKDVLEGKEEYWYGSDER